MQTQDLKRLMSMYQLWAHQMYPKTNLRDTLKTVEKLCHKRSVQVSPFGARLDLCSPPEFALPPFISPPTLSPISPYYSPSVHSTSSPYATLNAHSLTPSLHPLFLRQQRSLRQYRDDLKHGVKPSTSASTDHLDHPLSDDDEPQLRPFGAPSRTPAPPPPAQARPNVILGDEDFDDMFADEDEILAALDMEAVGGAGGRGAGPSATAVKRTEQEDEDEAMLALAEAEGAGGGWDEDEEAERAMREMEGM